MPRQRRFVMGAHEAVALALQFMEGLRDTGASTEAQAAALVAHLARDGFVLTRRIGSDGTRGRQPTAGCAVLTNAEVRAARISLGVSMAKLSKAAGISRETLRDFEQGQKVPHARTLAKLGAALEDLRRCDDRSR